MIDKIILRLLPSKNDNSHVAVLSVVGHFLGYKLGYSVLLDVFDKCLEIFLDFLSVLLHIRSNKNFDNAKFFGALLILI